MSSLLRRSGAAYVETLLGRCRIFIGKECSGSILPGEMPVVIDNLRASSTIVTALACGVEEIIPVTRDEDALSLQQQGVVIAGESGGVKLPGYDLGNSPVELLRRAEQQPFKTMAFKTSNLIPLLVALPHAWVCSSLNLQAIANHLAEKDVCIIAAGGENGVTEDLAVAIALHAHLNHAPFDEHLIAHFIQESLAARHLNSIGYAGDVGFIARVNIYDIIPYYDGKTIKRADFH